MTIQDVLDYVMTTPYNTNRQILKSMLEEISEGGEEGGDIPTITPEEETADGFVVDFSELTTDFFILEGSTESYFGVFVIDENDTTYTLLQPESGGPTEIFTMDTAEGLTELTYKEDFSIKTAEDFVKTCTIAIDENDVSNLEISAPSLAQLSGWSLTYLTVNGTAAEFYYLVDEDGDGGIQLDVDIKVAEKALSVKSNNATITNFGTMDKWFLSNIEDDAAVVLQLIDDK